MNVKRLLLLLSLAACGGVYEPCETGWERTQEGSCLYRCINTELDCSWLSSVTECNDMPPACESNH
jgi:hypothetical protein